MMKTAALYVRVSTHQQHIETQLLALREYASRRDIETTIEYSDVAWSGSKRRRPGLDQLMKDAKLKRFDVVIVQRFDRFARSAAHLAMTLEEFEALGIDFVSLNETVDTSTPIGRLTFWIIGAIAEMERSIIRERIADGLARARAEGKQLGRPKRIFDRKKVRDLVKKGVSLRQIAKKLKISRRTIGRAIEPLRKNP